MKVEDMKTMKILSVAALALVGLTGCGAEPESERTAQAVEATPKQVETLSEREKLMFRVKVRIPQELVLNHIAEVKTGVRGVAYIRLPVQKGAEQSPWTESLQQLPPDFMSAASINH